MVDALQKLYVLPFVTFASGYVFGCIFRAFR